MTDNKMVVFEGKQIKITKAEYDTFVTSITTQNPTKEEINLYLYDCDRRGVHPLDKLIYFTKRKGRYVPIIGIDYMRTRAESSGVYAGSDDAVFEDGDKFPVKATVTVWKMVDGRLGRFSATARWDEYKPDDLGAAASFMWKKMPHTMLAKCAEALALRKAFPGQLSGLYTSEEMAQDGRFIPEIITGAPETTKTMLFDQQKEAREEAGNVGNDNQDNIDSVSSPVVAEAVEIGSVEKFGKDKLMALSQINALRDLTGAELPAVIAVINNLEKGHTYTLADVAKLIKGE